MEGVVGEGRVMEENRLVGIGSMEGQRDRRRERIMLLN